MPKPIKKAIAVKKIKNQSLMSLKMDKINKLSRIQKKKKKDLKEKSVFQKNPIKLIFQMHKEKIY